MAALYQSQQNRIRQMAITSAVLALMHDQEFLDYVKLNFVQTADWVLGGNFPASVTAAEDKNTITKYMISVYKGNENLNAQVLMMLAQVTIQDKINANDIPGAYSIMQAQVRANLKNIAGCMPVY